MIDHDRLFKELLTTFFAEFVELFLPGLSQYIDRESITFLDKELFTDVPGGAAHRADLVARARCRGEESFLLIHLEHQAQSQAEFSRRMFGYFAALHARHRLPVYPIALFSHGALQPEPDEYRVGFPDLEVLRFRYHVIQLGRLHWRDYARRSNPVASALMARMGMRAEERPRVKLECLRLLVTLRLDPARMRLISSFIDTYLRLSAEEALQFRSQAATLLGEDEKASVMELTTSWKEEGIEIGRGQGIEIGRELGREREYLLLLRQLRKRFGMLEPGWEEKIRKFSFDQLEELGEAFIDFTSPQDLRNWLATR
jgi:hypothetical protein